MTPETILAELLGCGIHPGVTADRTGIVVPAGQLTPGQREAVLAHKTELILYLLESSRLTARLMDAAMKRCDEFNDSEEARQEMREQILGLPPELRQDLLDHFACSTCKQTENSERTRP